MKQIYRFSLFKFLHEANLSHILKTDQQNQFEAQHYPVMKNDVSKIINEMCSKQRSVNMLDCTVGTGAHAKLFLDTFKNLNIKGIDVDPKMIEKAKIKLEDHPDRTSLEQLNFSHVVDFSSFDVVFADLGYNIDQVLDPTYGLSYRTLDTPLDMRYDGIGLKASDIVNKFSQQELGEFFVKYGNLKQGARIAQSIVNERQIRSIETCGHLVSVCKQMGQEHAIPQVFQTLRILVNKEIESLQQLLQNILKHGRDILLLVITFHNLESSTVEDFSRRHRKRVKIQKIEYPKEQEVVENPRSRSAKLINLYIKGS